MQKGRFAALLILLVAGLVAGCQEPVEATTKSSDAKAEEAGKGGANLGGAELQPGIDPKQADARVGSATK